MGKLTKLVATIVCLSFVSLPVFAKGNSCWGEASAVFAQMGMMGTHSSQQDEPRLGLANLARILYDDGVIPEPTLNALATFVSAVLGLELDRCTADPALNAEAEMAAANEACWGQATMAFAMTGEMGQHASGQPTPRLGLRNLARALADAGVIADDSMASLGAFVAAELGLEIDACM